MADKFSQEVRSKIMKSIRSITKLEEIVCKEIWKRGIRFRRNVKGLFGNPDIAIKKYKIVIFIDSCFWHVCPIHGHIPKSNKGYWVTKLEKNVRRDNEVTQYYVMNGWNILRVWEHSVRHDFDKTIENIVQFIQNEKDKSAK